MSADKTGVESLLLDESFVNYCKKLSSEDVARWEEYLMKHPEDADLLESAKEVFFQLFDALALADLNEQMARLESRIASSSTAAMLIMEGEQTGFRR